MRWFILVVFAIFMVSCSSAAVMRYDYLPKSNYKYYAPLQTVDLKKNRYKLNIIDKRGRDKISCSQISLSKDLGLEGEKGLSFFKHYLMGMIEENNGVIDQENGKEIHIELNGISGRSYGFVVINIFGLVEFVTHVDGKTKTYCSEMNDDDEGSPLGGMVLTASGAERDMASASVRRTFQELMRDLSTFN